ncbi:MAG: carbon-nitrogen hydrolase family protein [Magnetococcales bacterium]|nr:carbon-nitrogen hydrolase family protein [Magnetococcales bacterium]
MSALAAVIQMNSGSDRSVNLSMAERLMEAAVARGARLLVLPENFSYFGGNEEEKRAAREDPENGPSLAFLKGFAARHRVWIVGGSIPLADLASGKALNTCFVVDETGSVCARYDKMHLFDVDVGDGSRYRESDQVRPGTRPVVVQTPFGRVGLAICYDLRFPELFRALVAQHAEIFTLPAAFTVVTGRDHWETLIKARAIENFAYVLAAGQWGQHAAGRQTYGRSLVVEPWGMVVAQCADGVGFALAPLERERVAQCRQRIPCLTHRKL